MRARAAVLATLAAIVMSLASAPSALGASTNRVLILGSTVTGGAQSLEATKAASLGYGVDIVSPTTWATLTPADFARYRAIVFGDPTCRVGTDSVAAAEANVGVWTPVVNGNVAVVGTDPVFHATFGINQPAARALSDNAVAFASAAPRPHGRLHLAQLLLRRCAHRCSDPRTRWLRCGRLHLRRSPRVRRRTRHPSDQPTRRWSDRYRPVGLGCVCPRCAGDVAQRLRRRGRRHGARPSVHPQPQSARPDIEGAVQERRLAQLRFHVQEPGAVRRVRRARPALTMCLACPVLSPSEGR